MEAYRGVSDKTLTYGKVTSNLLYLTVDDAFKFHSSLLFPYTLYTWYYRTNVFLGLVPTIPKSEIKSNANCLQLLIDPRLG